MESTSSLQVQISNRDILKIALPISLALLVPQINFITNNIFVSGLGETELGTAGITGVFYLIFALIGNGLNAGLQGLMSRKAGENNPAAIGQLFVQGLWVAMMFALTGIILTELFAPYFLSSSLHSPKVYEEAMDFYASAFGAFLSLYVPDGQCAACKYQQQQVYEIWVLGGGQS